jgi:hypothetical protein
MDEVEYHPPIFVLSIHFVIHNLGNKTPLAILLVDFIRVHFVWDELINVSS